MTERPRCPPSTRLPRLLPLFAMASRREPTPARAASLDAVAVLVEVVRARSFTGAARALGLPKSTVSVRVAELEAHLGVTLLHRTTRRVQPTPAGEAYFAAVARSLADLHAAGLEATQTQSAPSGLLRVTGTGAGTGDLGDRIAEYLALYPGVSVDLVLTNQRLDL
ncbi:MAG: LysR family transcriptional regulator, partial [Myxococcales bacterium]